VNTKAAPVAWQIVQSVGWFSWFLPGVWHAEHGVAAMLWQREHGTCTWPARLACPPPMVAVVVGSEARW
jgi:hypothetical protein